MAGAHVAMGPTPTLWWSIGVRLEAFSRLNMAWAMAAIWIVMQAFTWVVIACSRRGS